MQSSPFSIRTGFCYEDMADSESIKSKSGDEEQKIEADVFQNEKGEVDVVPDPDAGLSDKERAEIVSSATKGPPLHLLNFGIG